MARVILKNTFLSLETEEVQQDAPRRRACSEEPRRQTGIDSDMEMDFQLQRLGRVLERPRREKSDTNTNEISKLPFASQLALSSLASMGLMALQQRLQEAGVERVSEPVKCSKVGSFVRVASSDSISTMVPEESDGSEGVSAASTGSRARIENRRADAARTRAKLPARSRREARRAAETQNQGAAIWAYPDVSQMYMGGAWVSPEHVWGSAEDWWAKASSTSKKGCVWGSWGDQAEAAQLWGAPTATSW